MPFRLLPLCVVLAAGVVSAQQAPTFRAGVSAVRVHVSVVQDGRPVTGLTAEHFRVRDNRVLQEVELVVPAAHVDMTVLIDTSASLKDEALVRLREVAGMMVAPLTERDSVAVLTFTESAVPLVARQPAGGDVIGVLDPLHRRPASRTALWDAVLVESATLTGSTGNPYVAALTDGCDNSSWISPVALGRWLGRLDVTVDVVWFGSSHAEQLQRYGTHDVCFGPIQLEAVTRQNGGRIFRTADRQIERNLTQRVTELRSGYFLTYTPTGVKRDDGWHRLDVGLQNGARGRVTAREGYYAGGGSD
jgi:hypothetical protein